MATRFMISELDEIERAHYAFNFYGEQLMTVLEAEVYGHLLATSELGITVKEKQSYDPHVLLLASNGWDAFRLSTGRRILRDHHDQIVLNCCRRCGELARTPKARQCSYCGNDWHEERGDGKPVS